VNDPSVVSNKSADRSKGKNINQDEIHPSLHESEHKAVTSDDQPRKSLRQSTRRQSSGQEKVLQELSTLELLTHQASKIAEKEPASSKPKGKRSRKNSVAEQAIEETLEDIENPLVSPVRRRQKIKRKRFSICIDESITPEVR
jgi:hypothetical protein